MSDDELLTFAAGVIVGAVSVAFTAYAFIQPLGY